MYSEFEQHRKCQSNQYNPNIQEKRRKNPNIFKQNKCAEKIIVD